MRVLSSRTVLLLASLHAISVLDPAIVCGSKLSRAFGNSPMPAVDGVHVALAALALWLGIASLVVVPDEACRQAQ